MSTAFGPVHPAHRGAQAVGRHGKAKMLTLGCIACGHKIIFKNTPFWVSGREKHDLRVSLYFLNPTMITAKRVLRK